MQLGFVRVASRRAARPFRVGQATASRVKLGNGRVIVQRRSIINITLDTKIPSPPLASAGAFDTTGLLHKPLFVDEKRLLLGKLKWMLFTENVEKANEHLASLIALARQNGEKIDQLVLHAFTYRGITDLNAQRIAETVLSMPQDVLPDGALQMVPFSLPADYSFFIYSFRPPQ
jgi:hypothetical protein